MGQKVIKECDVPNCSEADEQTAPGWFSISKLHEGGFDQADLCPAHGASLATLLGWSEE